MPFGSGHRARVLARLVLAWFVLALGVAVAAPVVNPQSVQLVCSGSGAMQLLVLSEDGTEQVSGPTLDCPICANVTPPTDWRKSDAAPSSPLAHVLRFATAAHLASLTAAPLPARGPPAFS